MQQQSEEMPKTNYLWECPPRTKAKLEILSKYLGAWFGILANQGYEHVFYIDGFCGPGEYLGGEEGSPIVATRHANCIAQKNPNFKATLIFVDKDPRAIKHLNTLKEINNQHSNIKIISKEGEFSDEVGNIIKALQKNPRSPTFSFIDPFGFGQSPIKTLMLLMHNDSSEIFVNFWCGFMNRFKEHEDEDVTEKIKNMVGEKELSHIINAADSINALCIAFEKNLKKIGQYTLKFMMRDEKNIRDNAFFFCGQHPKGFERIKEAMWKVDPVHGNSFSAHGEMTKNSPQQDFFGDSPQTHELSALIQEKYAGHNNVSVMEIFKWVIEETDAFLPSHARIELEILNENGQIQSITDPSASTRKRAKNTWPARLLLSFTAK